MSQGRPIEHLFGELMDLKTPEERQEYLQQVCGSDNVLREQLEQLLEGHDRAGDFLPDSEGVPTTMQRNAAHESGATVGPYKLLQRIGEGGMGEVWMARQTHPVKREVALKLIKPGMDSRQVLARFEAERQALALMDHPNIAKVFEAGTTLDGHPYFVMELVRGQPITEYCDRHRLSPRERLELFVDTCGAIHHAHQKGVIHRDIKPSNVLVASYDGQPVVKVIDFGVAKAIGQQLTEHTLFTGFGTIVGTLEYMSPEQAEFNALDVDTRSDVYALGVLLYELLTGSTPISKTRMKTAAINELLRVIREEEPPRPSVRLSESKETLETISANRQMEPVRLTRLIRDDLDWLVMKALAKDRNGRYDSASTLAADVNRFLEGQPIEARPPSTLYRLRKSVFQHRTAWLAASLVFASLLVGVTISSWLAYRAMLAEREMNHVLAALRTELASAALNAAFRGNRFEAEDAIRRAETARAPSDLVQTLRGVAHLMDGHPAMAIQLLEESRRGNDRSTKTNAALFWAYWQASSSGKTDKMRHELSNQVWSDDDDYDNLFLALVRQATGNPNHIRETCQQLTRLIERHPQWGIAFSLRSSNRMEIGMESKDIVDFEQAVEDLQQAESLVPNSPFVESEGLYVLMVASDLAKSQGVDREEWRDHAAMLASRCEARPDYPSGREKAAKFFYLSGDEDRASRLESELVEQGVCEWSPKWALMFEEEKLMELERDLRSHSPDLDARICLALLFAEKSDEGRSESRKIFEECMHEDMPLTYYAVALDIPFLLGDAELGRSAAQGVSASRRYTQWRWWDYVIEYYADEISEAELLRRCGPFSNSGCVAHYVIGMKALAHGDREKARMHFAKSRDTRTVAWSPYHWAKAFADRLERDEQWPNWIGHGTSADTSTK